LGFWCEGKLERVGKNLSILSFLTSSFHKKIDENEETPIQHMFLLSQALLG